ncbi:AraC family transcriptional regulator [Myxococcus stipitatus DSM 14675]|uniref:AraC family transcriptional regulator n=1 Tax=Myxococcus stipitatus (strain DSM 14675 / JCM 12634 / Mx s8) TaxID=1278073 RepID=L7UGK9_MYXSD|nr:helix-turn-helix transcriptional regulator [Myxococcus stipitatus]AGC46707.1 AraC family transcriptional regulator [Myxococcus stipitatus DSM 14675]
MPKPLVDVDSAPASAFCLTDALSPSTSAWHIHRRHQLLYAASGALHLEVAEAQWLLPPQRAAWIAAGIRHRVRTTQAATLCTVYLEPSRVPAAPQGDCHVFVLPALAREMLLYSTRWGPERSPRDRVAESFFSTLAHLLSEWSAEPRDWKLPRARTPELERAMAYTLAHLADPITLAGAAKAAGLSQRTLARRFEDEAHTSWRRFLHDARMLRAMELLAEDGARVTQTAYAVGFESLAAFTHAFTAFTSERPRDFLRRVARGTVPLPSATRRKRRG